MSGLEWSSRHTKITATRKIFKPELTTIVCGVIFSKRATFSRAWFAGDCFGDKPLIPFTTELQSPSPSASPVKCPQGSDWHPLLENWTAGECSQACGLVNEHWKGLLNRRVENKKPDSSFIMGGTIKDFEDLHAI
ncbi:hypothetical protein OIU77_017373 [Salix suchowensis]|uniref:Uncharacterized protein n=1 Tax=Salix suchowensis TaxID=1278906 RepID=A0ABQ8ZNI9_9ROSI|nr:hypothetical protein OIU77_017373 [Salix suchowensis]